MKNQSERTISRCLSQENRRSNLAVSVAIALGLSTICAPAFANVLAVTNCTDHDPGSLRATIAGAAEGDTIDLSSLTCSNSTITLTTAQIVVGQNALTIQGPARGSFFTGGFFISGNSNFRVFNHKGTGTLELDGVTIENGKYAAAVAKGGCIYSSGSVKLNDSTITGCKANASSGKAGGGGIYALNTITLDHSTISGNMAESAAQYGAYGGGLRTSTLVASYSTIHGNSATAAPGAAKNPGWADYGGGAFIYIGANSTISNTTIDSNYAYGSGGGIFAFGGKLTISNSTVSENIAVNGDGGIAADNIELSNSTVALNHTSSAAGFGISVDGLMKLQSSIIAGNTQGDDSIHDVGCLHCKLSGAINLIQGFSIYGDSAAPMGLVTATTDPHLAPLGNHGGSTRTNAPLSGSPAIAAGYSVGILYDQRGTGFSRKTGIGSTSWTDLGAYQVQFDDDEIFYAGMESAKKIGAAWINTIDYGFSASGVAIDASGNVFVTNANSSAQELYAAGGYIATQNVGSGFSGAEGIVVDGSGNVFVADEGNGAVKEVLAAGGYVTVRTLASGLNLPSGVAVDGKGDVFVTEFGGGKVKEILAVGGSIPASPTITTLGSGFSNPYGIAVDGSGNVFVADFGNGTVKEILAVGGSIPASPTINTLGSGFSEPLGIAIDGSGNVFVADQSQTTVGEILAAGGYATVNSLGGGFSAPVGVAVDGRGDIFVADQNSVKEIISP